MEKLGGGGGGGGRGGEPFLHTLRKLPSVLQINAPVLTALFGLSYPLCDIHRINPDSRFEAEICSSVLHSWPVI